MRVSRSLPAVAALVVAALGVLSAAPARAADAPPDVDLQFEKYTLPNGLEVVLHVDPSAPQIAVNVWYHVGSGDEVPGKSGFAHLFEHMMFQGSKHTGEDVHFSTLEKLGASEVNGSTTSDRTNYFETVPKNAVETALWLESDRMGYLLDSLTEESFRNQVEVVRNERRQRYDNRPYAQARFAVAEALYPEGHPYRYLTIGRHEDLENASLEDVRGFFRTWYRPSDATLVVAGDFDSAAMKALVEKWFGGFPKLDKPARRDVPMPSLDKVINVDQPDPMAQIEQVQRTWIAPANLAEGTFELSAVGDVLGAQGWGRIYKRLVVQEALCGVVYAGYDGRGLSGEFSIVARLNPGGDRAKVEAILDEEVAKVLAEPVSDAELHRVVINTESEFIWGLEDLTGRADQLQWFNHYTGDPGYAAKYLQRLRAVTPASLQATAKAWLGKPYVQVVTVPAPAGGAAPDEQGGNTP